LHPTGRGEGRRQGGDRDHTAVSLPRHRPKRLEPEDFLAAGTVSCLAVTFTGLAAEQNCLVSASLDLPVEMTIEVRHRR
jgi:organic hydroperoxide reductase OsmC/OhrA